MKTTWQEDVSKKQYSRLSGNVKADVAIVGGGLAGINTAYLLAKAGKKVVVLEWGEIGSGASAYTTAMITHWVDTSLTQLEEMFGSDKAKRVWESGRAAIDRIEQNIKDENIQCDFTRVPLFVYAYDNEEKEYLEEEVATAKKFGFDNTSMNSGGLPFNNSGYAQLTNQAKFHPLKYLYGLAEAAVGKGATIFENSEVKEIVGNLVKTEGGSVEAESIIVATYYPFNNPKPTHYKKGMYITYTFEVEIPKNYLPEGLYADMESPYHFFRVDRGENSDRMLFGGEDHRKEIPMSDEKNFKVLKKHMHEVFGRDFKIVKQWPGQILEPSDGLALIGEYEPKRYVASAFSGTGMIYSHVSAMLLSDLILGKQNPWIDLYDPKRKPSIKQLLTKGKDYFDVFMGGAVKNFFSA